MRNQPFYSLLGLCCFIIMIAALNACGSDDDTSALDGDAPAADGDSDDDAVADGDSDEPVSACLTDLEVGEKLEFVSDLAESEGIAFDGLGHLYVSETDRVLRIAPDGSYSTFSEIPQAIGMAFDENGDLLVASLGEQFDDETQDGSLYLVTPDGSSSLLLEAGTILNPNFVTRTPWGTWLIGDDYVPEIWEVTDNGEATLWSDAIESPNGMVFTADGNWLYVASTFEDGSPIYRLPIDNGQAGEKELVVNLTPGSMNDGVAMDSEGYLYVAANVMGEIIRISPTGETQTIASGLLTPASLAFGEGDGFDPCSLYVTELRGNRVWRISLGVSGLALFR